MQTPGIIENDRSISKRKSSRKIDEAVDSAAAYHARLNPMLPRRGPLLNSTYIFLYII